MSTTDHVLLIILTSLLSLFFLLLIVMIIGAIQLVAGLKRIVTKAESVVDSVEAAAEVLQDTSGRLAFFKLLRNIIKIMQRSSKDESKK